MLINNDSDTDAKYKVLEASSCFQMGQRVRAFEIVNQLLLAGAVTFEIPRHLMVPSLSQQQTQASS